MSKPRPSFTAGCLSFPATGRWCSARSTSAATSAAVGRGAGAGESGAGLAQHAHRAGPSRACSSADAGAAAGGGRADLARDVPHGGAEWLSSRRPALMLEPGDQAGLAKAAHRRAVLVGAMLEVPALMRQLPALLPSLDFISVGRTTCCSTCSPPNGATPGSTAATTRFAADAEHVPPSGRLVRCGRVPLSVCGEMARPLDAMAFVGIRLPEPLTAGAGRSRRSRRR